MTIIDTGAATVTDQISGRVSTPVTLYRSLPDRVAHATFGLEQPGQPAVAVHVAGALAERTRVAVHRGDHVQVLEGEAHQRPNAHVVDVDAAELVVTLH